MKGKLTYTSKTKRGNSKVTKYTPTKGLSSNKSVTIRKKNGKVMIIKTTIKTIGKKY